MKKIEKLTKKQKDQMESYAQYWIDKGLQTGETDWETFDKYMRICYKKAGLEYPSRVVHVPSPFLGAHVASVAHEIWNSRYKKVGDSVNSSVESSVNSSVRDLVYSSVDSSVGELVHSSVRASVTSSVGDSVNSSVGALVGDSVESSVGDLVRDSVESSVGALVGASQYEQIIVDTIQKIARENSVQTSWNHWLGGQFWVGGYWYWGVAYVNYFFDVCNLKLSKDIMERAEAYRKVCESVNYIWLNRDFIIVCARPVHIDKTNNKLHSESRMAIQYPDGWGLYMLHGVRFEKDLWEKITQRQISFKEVMEIKNIEHRMAALKVLGAEYIIANTNAEIVDTGSKGAVLYLVKNIYSVDAYFVKYADTSTGRVYISAIPPKIGKQSNADMAMAWKQDITLIEYLNIQAEA